MRLILPMLTRVGLMCARVPPCPPPSAFETTPRSAPRALLKREARLVAEESSEAAVMADATEPVLDAAGSVLPRIAARTSERRSRPNGQG